jgi:hypothetical protein
MWCTGYSASDTAAAAAAQFYAMHVNLLWTATAAVVLDGALM